MKIFCVDSIITVSETICLMKLNKLYQPSFQRHQIYNIKYKLNKYKMSEKIIYKMYQ